MPLSLSSLPPHIPLTLPLPLISPSHPQIGVVGTERFAPTPDPVYPMDPFGSPQDAMVRCAFAPAEGTS